MDFNKQKFKGYVIKQQDLDLSNDVFNITQTVINQIAKEQDEQTMLMIEEYIKIKQNQGECISANIIPEGKLRHIINLGLTMYNAREMDKPITNLQLFPQEEYIEYLRRQLLLEQRENQKLKNEIAMITYKPAIQDLESE